MCIFSRLTYSLDMNDPLNRVTNPDLSTICKAENEHTQNDHQPSFPCQQYGQNTLCPLEYMITVTMNSALNTGHFKILNVFTDKLIKNSYEQNIDHIKYDHDFLCIKYLEEWSGKLSLKALFDLASGRNEHISEKIHDTTINHDNYNEKLINLEKYETICKSSIDNINRLLFHYPVENYLVPHFIKIKSNLGTFVDQNEKLLQILYKRNKNSLNSGYIYTKKDFINSIDGTSDLPTCSNEFKQNIMEDINTGCKIYFSNCLFSFVINVKISKEHTESENEMAYYKNIINNTIIPQIEALNNNFINKDKYPNSSPTKENDLKYIIEKYLLHFSIYDNDDEMRKGIIDRAINLIPKRVGSTVIIVLNIQPASYYTIYNVETSYLVGTGLSEDESI